MEDIEYTDTGNGLSTLKNSFPSSDFLRNSEDLNDIMMGHKNEEGLNLNSTDIHSNEASNGRIPPKKDKEEFNEASEDGWIDIIGTGGLKKRIVKEGICESRPSKCDTVKIKATGRLEDESEVDFLDNTEFTVGVGEVINGLDMVVELMFKGEICDVFMEARFAYGDIGLAPRIPGGSNLYYRVELVDYKPEDEPESLSVQDRLSIGIRKRERGNWWFKREEFEQSIKCYKSAVDFLDDTSDTHGEVLSPELKEILEERLKTLNNLAASQIKLEAYDVALISVESILRCQPQNVKALYRKGKILGIQGEAKKGLEALLKAASIEPDSRLIIMELNKLKEKVRQDAESEKSLYRRMLGLKPGQCVIKGKGEDKYPTMRGGLFKIWGVAFLILLAVLFTFNYRDYAFRLFN